MADTSVTAAGKKLSASVEDATQPDRASNTANNNISAPPRDTYVPPLTFFERVFRFSGWFCLKERNKAANTHDQLCQKGDYNSCVASMSIRTPWRR